MQISFPIEDNLYISCILLCEYLFVLTSVIDSGIKNKDKVDLAIPIYFFSNSNVVVFPLNKLMFNLILLKKIHNWGIVPFMTTTLKGRFVVFSQ